MSFSSWLAQTVYFHGTQNHTLKDKAISTGQSPPPLIIN